MGAQLVVWGVESPDDLTVSLIHGSASLPW